MSSGALLLPRKAGRNIPGDSFNQLTATVPVESVQNHSHSLPTLKSGPDEVLMHGIDSPPLGIEAEVIRKNVAARMFQRMYEPELVAGRYVLRNSLGKGAKGTVFLAEDQRLHRKLAIKLLHEHEDRDERMRLVREAQALAKIRHENIVQVYDANNFEDQVYLAMELIEGSSLRAWEQTQDNWKVIVDAYRQAGAGLLAAHQHGFTHRDFKPENVLVEHKTGRVCVADFGLVKHVPGLVAEVARADARVTAAQASLQATPTYQPQANSIRLTKTDKAAGTPLYMSCEALFLGQADARSDQFSFCVALYIALCGNYPFTGQTPPAGYGDLVNALDAGKVHPFPKKLKLPKWLLTVLTRGLSRDPDKRYPSMAELLADLDYRRREGRIWQVVGGTAIVGAAVLIYIFSGAPPPPCQGAADEFASTWSAEARQQVEAAKPGAQAELAVSTMDQYRDDWVEVHTELCQKTVDRRQTEAVFAGQARCLDRLKNEAGMLLAQGGISAAQLLPAIADLADPEECRYAGAEVPSPQLKPEVAHVENLLAQAHTQTRLGDFASAEALLEQAVADAPKAFAPIVVEARIARADLAILQEDGETAENQLYAAKRVADRNDLKSQYAEALAKRIKVNGYLRKQEITQEELDSAEDSLEKIDSRRLRAMLQNNLGLYYLQTQGDLDRAIELLKQAYEYRKGRHPLDELDTLVNLVSAMRQRKNLAQAEQYYKRGIALDDRYYAQNPEQTPKFRSRRDILTANYANALLDAGRLDEAVELLTKTLDKRSQALGGDHRLLVEPLRAIALVYENKNNYKEAEKYVNRLLEIDRTQKLRPLDHATIYGDLGRVKYFQDDQLAQSERALVEALRTWEQLAEQGLAPVEYAQFLRAQLQMVLTQLELEHIDAATQGMKRAQELYAQCSPAGQQQVRGDMENVRAVLKEARNPTP